MAAGAYRSLTSDHERFEASTTATDHSSRSWGFLCDGGTTMGTAPTSPSPRHIRSRYHSDEQASQAFRQPRFIRNDNQIARLQPSAIPGRSLRMVAGAYRSLTNAYGRFWASAPSRTFPTRPERKTGPNGCASSFTVSAHAA